MEITEMRNGFVMLKAENGIIRTQDGKWFSEVVCLQKDIDKYRAA